MSDSVLIGAVFLHVWRGGCACMCATVRHSLCFTPCRLWVRMCVCVCECVLLEVPPSLPPGTVVGIPNSLLFGIALCLHGEKKNGLHGCSPFRWQSVRLSTACWQSRPTHEDIASFPITYAADSQVCYSSLNTRNVLYVPHATYKIPFSHFVGNWWFNAIFQLKVKSSIIIIIILITWW